MASVSAISGPVNRSRRSAAIASIRPSHVRLAIVTGVDGRSSSPHSPSSRKRPTHLRAQRTLTSAAAAALVSVHPCSTTRWQSTRRALRLSAALACSFIRCPPWDWWRQTPPASKEARMNQPPQELQLIWPDVCQAGSTKGPRLRAFLLVERDGGRACARRAVRLICAGWVPQDRVSSQSPSSRSGRRRRAAAAHSCVTDALARRAGAAAPLDQLVSRPVSRRSRLPSRSRRARARRRRR
jgi:hypothetical protein